MAALEQDLEALHVALAGEMKRILTDGETAVDQKTGEVVRTTPSAGTLNAIRQFLKDNGIETKPGEGTPTADLASKLPFAGDARSH